MNGLLTSGRYLFAIALVGFGIEHFIFAHSPALTNILPYTADGPVSAWLMGAGLILSSLSFASGAGARFAGRLLGGLLILDFLIVHVPRMAAALRDAGVRTRGFETLSMAAIALILAATSLRASRSRPLTPDRAANSVLPPGGFDRAAAQIARFLFAMALFIFGAQHFSLIPFIASLIPAWMPGRVFLAYFTGAAMVAAALSIATGRLIRLAGVLLALMFLIWVATLHAPRVAHALHNGDEWCSLLVPVALAGGGLIVAGAFG